MRRGWLICMLALALMMVTSAAMAWEFRLTTGSYSEVADLNAAIDGEFGVGWRLADWTDILQVWNSDQDAFPEVMDIIGTSTRFISYYGGSFWSGNRHYIVAVHNHNVPAGWLVHDHIDNHLVDVGSWYDPHRALAFIPEPSSVFALGCGMILLPLVLRRS